MTEATLGHTQTRMQLMSIALMTISVCFYAGYWIWMAQAITAPNGRWRIWYALYGAPIGLARSTSSCP